MTFPSLKSENSSKRNDSRSRSRSRSNRKRSRRNRRRNRRNYKYNNNQDTNINMNETDHNHNHNLNKNRNKNTMTNNSKMEIDSDEPLLANNSILSTPINQLNLTDSTSFNSSSSSLLSSPSSSSLSSSSLSISSQSSSSLSLSSSLPSASSSFDYNQNTNSNTNSKITIINCKDSSLPSISSVSYLDIVRSPGKNRKFKARKRRRNRNKNKNKNKNKIKPVTKQSQTQSEQSVNEQEQEQQPMNLDQVLFENENQDEQKEDIQEDTERETEREREREREIQIETEERREFRFNIEDDSNLRDIINNTLTRDNLSEYGLMPTTNNTMNNVNDNLSANTNELTSEYILSKLYNYMKISEMSKYGISVFEMTFTSYLPYLSESDLTKLATSYWCNGQHFNCMISHRGDIIKSGANYRQSYHSYFFQDEDEIQTEINKERLELVITADLLDAAMQSGASVDKIEAMLLQKRIDDGINSNKKLKRRTSKDGRLLFYQTKYEKNFYLRNLKHRFWNHEVLVRVFIQNGWLTPNLAETAMKTFIKTIYNRVLQTKLSQQKYNNDNNHNNRKYRNRRNNNNNNNNNNQNNVKFSENFLHSFFVSYFCLDDIPKMYKEEIKRKMDNNDCSHNKYISSSLISEETLRRWCELIELLASRGGNINEIQFKKVIPLQYALQLGKNTYKIISATHSKKNQLFIPDSFHQENISVPNDIWDVMVSYL